MPMQNVAAILEEILNEADALIRQRRQVILRSNVSANVLRSFGEDLKNVADDLTAPRKPGDTTHC
jgi:hypothetical protein